MSERNTPPAKEGGMQQATKRPASDAGLSKTGGGKAREAKSADDIEREDSPGGRDGGMIDEG